LILFNLNILELNIYVSRILTSFFVILCISIAWFVLDYINDVYLGFLQVSQFVSAVYWLSGLRLLVIILFNEVGAIGLFLGYVLSGVLIRDFALQDALILGVLSSLAPVIAYKLWLKITHISSAFENVNFNKLFLLVFLHSAFTAVFRTSYLYLSARASNWQEIVVVFASNVCGALLFLYALKYVNLIYRAIKTPK